MFSRSVFMAEILQANGSVTADEGWILLADSGLPDPEKLAPKSVVPYAYWRDNHAALKTCDIGIVIPSDAIPEGVAEEYEALPIIFIDFPVFSDGRGFSIARMLRDKLGYRGDLRARGHYIQDQLGYLVRCGFTSFLVEEDKLADTLKKSLQDFSDAYQTDSNGMKPVYARA